MHYIGEPLDGVCDNYYFCATIHALFKFEYIKAVTYTCILWKIWDVILAKILQLSGLNQPPDLSRCLRVFFFLGYFSQSHEDITMLIHVKAGSRPVTTHGTVPISPAHQQVNFMTSRPIF